MQPIVILLILCTPVYGLIGYDCGGQHLNITSVSLLGVGDCDIKVQTPNTTKVYIKLLQLSEYGYAEIIQCKAELSRTVYYCGMHSHISLVANSRMDYLLEMSRSKCLTAIEEGTIKGTTYIIDGLRPNTTTSRSVILAGSVDTEGRCTGTQYSDHYGEWKHVVVDGIVKISLKTGYVPVHLNSGRIILKSGTVCTLSDGFCIDSENGYTFWNPMPTTSCNFQQYDVLYEGVATKMVSNEDASLAPTVYSLVTQDITFALTTTRGQPLCGYTLLSTEHPKLFVLETTKDDTFGNRGTVPVRNLDIFTYVNSKFVYVEKHVRQQMTSLYHNVVQQRCELEKEVLRNTLSFATLQPDEFAYRLMKGPGYMAVAAGETIHVIKCIPVDVSIRRTEECYLELPVTVRNSSLFLTPKSRILTKAGTVRECSYELPTTYFIEDTWVQFTPKAHVRETSPQQLQPMTSLSWKYLTPGSLATSGIYSQADIDKLRNYIMFPAEKPALLNTMARGMTGHAVQDGSVSLYNLLDEQSLQKIAESTASRIWGGFITFGSATAGVLGVLIVVRLIKLTIDIIIHGYALHSAYGCSLYVLGAVWSSLTNLLLYLSKGPHKPSAPNNPDDSGDAETTAIQLRPPAISNTEARDNETCINMKRSPTIYHDLYERMHKVEQISPNTSKSVLK